MIVTRRRVIPFYWILLAATPWGAASFTWNTMGTAFLFSLKKFVENPAGLTFILTLPAYISIFVGPLCSFLSDRIWTRIGRRKTFIIVSWVGVIGCLILLPLMPNLIALIGVYIAYAVFMDIGSPVEVLKQEIVPPPQRGRATATMQWMQNLGSLTFSFVALGRFDDVRYMGGLMLSGEKLIYWSAALLMTITFLFLAFGIKEIDPKSPSRGQRLSFFTFFNAIMDRDLWPVYTLFFGAAMLGAGLGPLSNLLYTDQWGYSKQDMGTNVAVGGVLNIFIIGFLGMIADRLNRMRAYQVLITLSLLLQAFYFVYVEFILPDRRPSLVEIILFGETGCILGLLTSMIYVPLVYDYIIRDKMGTYGAGAGLLGRVTGIITLNAMGLFIWGYAVLFQPPAGEMVRVCLKEPANSTQVNSLLQAGIWRDPADNTVVNHAFISARPWYSNGIISSEGSCWEIRMKDGTSEDFHGQMEDLQSQLTPVLAEEKSLRDEVQIDQLRHQSEAAKLAQQKADLDQHEIDIADKKIERFKGELAQRAENFRQQVTQLMGGSLLTDGDQILSARMAEALVVEVPVQFRPSVALEKTLVEMRRQGLNVIDLRPIKHDDGYGVAVSALLEPDANEEALAGQLVKTLQQLSARREPGLLAPSPHPFTRKHQTAVVLNVRIVEEPLDQHASPVTRLVNAGLELLDSAPQPEHRLAAAGRSLRLNDETEHVGISPGPDNAKTIFVTALLLPTATRSLVHDATTRRLQDFLGASTDSSTIAEVRAFYQRLVDSAALQNITVERPVLACDYASMKYDYMSGYLGIIFLGLIGLAITFAFGRWEKMGKIRKLGLEEALAP